MPKIKDIKEVAEKYGLTEEDVIELSQLQPNVRFFFADEEPMMHFLKEVMIKLNEYMGAPIEINNVNDAGEFNEKLKKMVQDG